ncbi:MAG: hypothetical protein K2Y31_13980 [Burkholderiales bacterium]|jgi:hypothetical protein|nr:hypothetical protein [Burkholderiales bacterium]
MPRRKRKMEELKLGSIELSYEYRMHVELSKAILGNSRHQETIENAILESYLLHTRSLIDFFYNRDSDESDDIVAQDFMLPSKQWGEIRPPMPEKLKQAKIRANKYLAHLTYERTSATSDTKFWDVQYLYKSIRNLMSVFLENVKDENLSDYLITTKENFKD